MFYIKKELQEKNGDDSIIIIIIIIKHFQIRGPLASPQFGHFLL